MPDSWDPAVYRDRAKRWRERAACLSTDDPAWATCLELAEGYERLTALLEQRNPQLVCRSCSDNQVPTGTRPG